MRRWFWFVLALFLPFDLTAQAPTFRETVVVTAAGEEEPLDQVAAAVTEVDQRELARSLEASLAAVLRRSPGVVVLRSGLDGGVTSLFSRGTNSNQTLVLFEGVRLNDPYFGGYDWSLPLTTGVGKVELVRGPFSALYGADALGGVVQLLAPQGAGTSWSLFGEGGSQGWRRWQGGWSTTGKGWDLALWGVERNGSGTLDNDDFWGKAVTFSAGWRPRPNSRLGLLVRDSRSRTEIPFSGAQATPRRWTAAGERLVAVPWRMALHPHLQVEGHLARLTGQLSFRDPDDPWGYTAADSDKESLQGRLVFKARVGTHRLQWGGEWRQDEVTAGSSFGPDLQEKKQGTRSLFLQDRWGVGKAGDLTLGLRWDRAGAWEQWSPRVSWGLPLGTGRLWLAAGRAFRAPTLGERFYPFSGNPALQPERSASLELGTNQVLAGSWLAQLVAFANRVEDLVDFDYTTWRFANLAEARQRGVELALEQRREAQFLRLAATYWITEDDQDRPLLRRPKWSGSCTWGGRWSFGEGEVSLVYVGRRADLDPVSLARVQQGGFFTAQVAARILLVDPLSLTLRVDNLADRAYQEVRGFPAPGRRFFLGLSLAGGAP
ncbi:MAG: TonB-dependent receptor [Thermoanaerobaculum sp.]|nr:TonB-dependent receptor [Thermoanaerobaculum sp.]MDW7967923.1 TonB-dependent receptor [Thermoanaerobaculum sp.]